MIWQLASASNKHGLFVVGGQDGSNKFNGHLEFLPNLHSSTFIKKAKVPLPNKIEGLSGACMVSIDENTLFLVGGYLSGYEVTSKTWKYNIKKDAWYSSVPMKQPRAHHACSLIRDKNSDRTKVIVVGGSIEDGSSTNSVEIYDPGRNEWTNGTPFPTSIMYSQMVEDEIQGGVLLVGGRTTTSTGSIKRTSDIYHLPNTFKKWKKLGQTIELGRESHVALMLPDDINHCYN